MSLETNINKNGEIKDMEEKNMNEVDINVNGINLVELVEQAAIEAKYSGLKSFFENDEGNTKDYVKVGEYFDEEKSYRIIDAAYIIPKDRSKEEFAVVSSELRPNSFTYLNRSGKEFILRLKDIAKSQKISIAKILKQVNVHVQVKKKLRKGYEGREFGITEDGSFNWFYDYVITVVK